MKKEKRRMNNRLSGFTLVELIVVLVILSVVSAIAVPSVLGYIDDGKAKECKSRLNALTADVTTAKLSYEVDGEEGGEEFDVGAYIASVGDEGRCPVADVPYEYKADEHIIVCPKGHGEGSISDSGKFTVAVVENTDKRESRDDTHKYNARIQIESGSANMELGDHSGLHVTVTDEHGNPVPDDRVTVTWSFPTDGSVQGTSNGTSATVDAKKEGGGQVSCTVTVTKEDGTKETVPCDPIDITVTDSEKQPEPKYNAEIVVDSGDPNNMEPGDHSGLHVTVTDEHDGTPIPDDRVTVTWSFPTDGSVQGTPNGTSTTVDAKKAGGGQVSCTVTVTKEDGTTETVPCGSIDVTVTEAELGLEVSDVSVKENEDGKIGARATDGNGGTYPREVEYHYEVNMQPGDDGEITVDENGNIHGSKSGTCHVTVTVTDKDNPQKKTSKTVEVTVEQKETEPESQPEKEGSIFDPDHVRIWIEDTGDSFNVSLNKYVNNLPKGNWYYEGSERVEIFNQNADQNMQIWDSMHSGVFRFRFEADDGRIDWLTVYFGYPLSKISQLGIYKAGTSADAGSSIKVNDSIDCKAQLDPYWTSDVRADRQLQWEIQPSDAPVDIVYNDDKHTSVTLTAKGVGKFRVRAYTTREKDKEIREEISREITIGEGSGDNQQQETQNQNQSEDQGKITGLTLNPSSMTLKAGQSKQLEAILETDGGDIDMSKVRYVFTNQNSYALDMTSNNNTAVVTGVVAQQQGAIGVNIYYGNDNILYASCQVNVVGMPVDQAAIGEDCFDAISWEQFKKNVEDGVAKNDTYGVNRHHGDSTEVVLFYDEVDAGNGVKKRILYMARGNTAYFETVGSSTNFSEYMKTDAGERFFVVDLENIKDINEEDLENAESKKGGWPNGTVVRVKKAAGGYEYYVSYNEGDGKTQLKDILKDQTDKDCGWWKLNILS